MNYLTYRPTVRKTPAITRTSELLDPFFEGELSEITSGLRSPADQLNIIFEKADRWKIREDFPEVLANIHNSIDFTVHIDEINRDLFWWQRLWSKLLNIGDIVNPPYPAEVIFDYFRPGSQDNKKGEIIQISPHQRGTAFDIGGGNNLLEKAKRVMKAHQSQGCFIKSLLLEHINNSVHVDVFQIG